MRNLKLDPLVIHGAEFTITFGNDLVIDILERNQGEEVLSSSEAKLLARSILHTFGAKL